MSSMNALRHPSLDNLRRSNHHTSRSYPQLLSEFNTRPSSTAVPEDDETLFMLTIGYITAAAALVCLAGLLIVLSILYLTVKPFSETLYRRLAATMGLSSILDAMAILLPNVRLYLTGDSDVPSPVGTSILVANHLMDGDWYSIMMLGRCVGLRGSIKVFLRNECLDLNKKPHSSTDLVIRTDNPSSSTSTPTPSPSSSSQLRKSVSFNNRTTGTTNSRNGLNYGSHARKVSPLLSFAARLLHTLLDFPVLSGENNSYIEDRDELFSLLKSFARDAQDTPVHLLLFPEGWSLHNGADRKAVVAKSNEFAKREGRPQLKHLLLPRTTGFNASLEKLRDSSPVVYDVTMAYRGYDGAIETSLPLTLPVLWKMLRRPREIHLHIKRYSMEEVLQDASWLDKQWAEKDRLLGHFSRHQQFPLDSRGFCRYRVFDARNHAMENSVLSLLRLLVIPCTMPIILLLSIPLFWIILWMWVAYKAYQAFFPGVKTAPTSDDVVQQSQTPGPDSATGTPFFPATPFASPSVTNWRDMMLGNANESPVRR